LDLALYFPGLASTLSFASLTVRPLYLSLLQSNILELPPDALRPALKSIVLALLPGLEDETSEDFEQTLKLVDSFRVAVRSDSDSGDFGGADSTGDGYFWQCFFLATITSKTKRQGALAFLVRQLPKLGDSTFFDPEGSANGHFKTLAKEELSVEALAVVTPEPGLLIRCFEAGLSDEQLLVQRGYLDLLVTHLPLHSSILQQKVVPTDLDRLLSAAAGVVVRRDMSLNRRLWAWLLGPETSSENVPSSPTKNGPMTSEDATSHDHTRYFARCGLQPLVRGLRSMINNKDALPTERARPYRICLSLMDKWEVGGLVVPEIFLPIIESVREYENQSNQDAFKEVLRSASVFFDGVESGLIWGELVAHIASALGESDLNETARIDKLSMVKFVISHFNIREEEMLVIHIPMVVLAVLVMVQRFDAHKDAGSIPKDSAVISKDLATLAFTILEDLMELVPERAFLMASSANDSLTLGRQGHQWTLRNDEIIRDIRKFYTQDQGSLELSTPPFSARDVGDMLLREISSLMCHALQSDTLQGTLLARSKLLVTVLRKVPRSDTLKPDALFDSFHDLLLSDGSSLEKRIPFSTFTALSSAITSLYSHDYLSDMQISQLIVPLIREAWVHITPSNPKYHVEAVRCAWQLQMILPPSDRRVEGAFSTLLTEHTSRWSRATTEAEAGRRFAILWTHSVQLYSGQNDTSTTAKKLTAEDKKNGALKDYKVMLTRPLFLVLDSLSEEGTESFIFTRGWLQNLTKIDSVLGVFVSRFLTMEFLDNGASSTSKNSDDHADEDSDDLDSCIYYLQTLSNVLRWSSANVWVSLANDTLGDVDEMSTRAALDRGFKAGISLQVFFAHICMRATDKAYDPADPERAAQISKLHRTSLAVLHQLLRGPHSTPIAEMELEKALVEKLIESLNAPDTFVQVALLDVLYAALKLNLLKRTEDQARGLHQRQASIDTIRSHVSSATEQVEKEKVQQHVKPPLPPSDLVKCLQGGFSSVSSRPVLDSWINFLVECLPLFSDSVFQILIPLVEVLCNQISETFEGLKTTFQYPGQALSTAPESTLISLLNGLEQVLASAHDRLQNDEMKLAKSKSPELPQGFFGNMVSGVFAAETPQTRSATANNRLTVLLSFADTVQICFSIWAWGSNGASVQKQDQASISSFNYTSLRMRNRARRILEHLFQAETLECLETLVGIWQKSDTRGSALEGPERGSVFSLLNVLDGSMPKNTIPAIFNALYSRANPQVLDPSRKSTLTSELVDRDLVAFLVTYARSIDDDAMDEIWSDCMVFLKDVLANPFPHRLTLPKLLEFAAILGEKVDNTNFGEQRKMRRELGVSLHNIVVALPAKLNQDLFLRLLTATFATRPMAFTAEARPSTPSVNNEKDANNDDGDHSTYRMIGHSDDVLSILGGVVVNLQKILVEPERILGAVQTISASVIGPTIRSKSFPNNVTKGTLDLMYQLARIPNAQKVWKRDIADAFNDVKFFASNPALVQTGWNPLLRQWVLGDKERMPELLARLYPPTTAGIVFGVGATSARIEADRKTQLNLRRIALVILAADEDNFLGNLPGIEEKLVELMTATAASSPSSNTRAEIYMVLRALILKTTAIHLGSFWPLINSELQIALTSVLPGERSDEYTNVCVYQACKLLDTLLVIAPDEFQLHEWLFITDTIDAVYRPITVDHCPVALVDEIAHELVATTALTSGTHSRVPSASFNNNNINSAEPVPSGPGTKKRPLLSANALTEAQKVDLMGLVLKPFFSQLSIYAFESTYSMSSADSELCIKSLVKDLFDESTIA
jgi:Dopey, N-terminal